MEIELLKKKAYDLRKDVLEVCYRSKAGHIGGSLSAIDIINTLYFKEMSVETNKDLFILSKGHVAEALYVVLANKGYFDKRELIRFSKYNSLFIGHPNNKVPGIEMNTGALGHGLSIGAGYALAAKKKKTLQRVYILMGDGELAEGSIWEAAMSASHYRLDNLCAIIDRNGLQISGTTEEVMSLENVSDKWKAFGFHVIEMDGHNYENIIQALKEAKETKGKPTMLIANTIKGKGISFMENDSSWHHGVMNEKQYHQAIRELEEASHESN
jgi:transketolase